ncbi:MAG TPA: hypothetical protein VFX98_18930 [Longimicrobiaceae bacterium]|nr:hypothetical protein [Longimicrobiaceae bacterium]
MRFLLLLCLAAALGTPPAAAAAQAAPDTSLARPGTRMRVTAPSGVRRQGRFWFLRGDTVWLLTGLKNDSLAVALAGGERIEVTPGRKREQWSAGCALLGGVLALLATQLAAEDVSGNQQAGETGQAVVATAGGFITGGLLGWFIAPERWRTVTRRPAPPPPPPASP